MVNILESFFEFSANTEKLSYDRFRGLWQFLSSYDTIHETFKFIVHGSLLIRFLPAISTAEFIKLL